MVAEPAFSPCTLPLPSTLATTLSEDDQVTVLSAASAGEILAVNFVDSPSVISIRSGETATEETVISSVSLPLQETMSKAVTVDTRKVCEKCLAKKKTIHN